MATEQDYLKQKQALLPPGKAFNRDKDSDLTALLESLCPELKRIDDRARQLLKEAYPDTTLELLPDWERVAGLPDPCLGDAAQSTEERRAALVAKLTQIGSATPQYFIDLAASLGFEVTITEYRPFQVGRSQVGDALTNGPWVYTWQVSGPEVTVSFFRTGVSRTSERLGTFGNELLECTLNAQKPAHTLLIFTYGD